MENEYNKPIMEVIVFDEKTVVITSNYPDEWGTPELDLSNESSGGIGQDDW